MTTTISAEAVGNNIDLLTEILLRLPVKPLGKFKCVSKRWLSLISDPEFRVSHIHHHHSRYPTPISLLHVSTSEFEMVPLKPDIMIPEVPSFEFLNAPRIRIRQSCNGLLLCSSRSNRQSFYHICNPTTKQFKTLSPPACQFREYSVSSVCMAFDSLKSNHYKLIDVCRDNYHIEMYSSETDSWSPLEITFTPPNRMNLSSPVFCNGAIHWYSKDETSLYFDVDTECFNKMPMPKVAKRYVRYFGESRGHLHLIVTKLPSPSQFDVWEMAADYSGWFVLYHVNLDAVRTAFPHLIWYREERCRFSVLDLIRAQKEEDSILVISVDNEAISYNLPDGTSKKLYDMELPVKYDFTWCEFFRYFESLISV